jgi:hypothetical protein
MSDGTVVDTEHAQQTWEEAREHDGRNLVSKATGSQWDHQTLYRSRKGRYYVERRCDWQGARAHVEWISREEGARWLLANDHELPSDLADLASEVME